MTTRRATPDQRLSSDVTILVLFAAAAAVAAVAYCCWSVAIHLLGDIPDPASNAFARPGTWPGLAIVLTALGESALVAVTTAVLRKRVRRHEIERRAKVMAPPRRLREVTGADARKKARRLRGDLDVVRASDIGLPMGPTVIGGQPVYMSWEDVGAVLGGPRTGKTASVAIGAVCAAPGPVIATSNKRDLHDHCRGVRESGGRRAWVSDLQGRAGEPAQDWWWNILAGVDRLPTARRLAAYFQAETRIPDAKADNYFEGGALELVALYLLAAAVSGGDIVHAYSWLSYDDCPVPARQLDDHHQPIAAAKVRTAQSLNVRQRDGLFDMARRMLTVLSDEQYAATVLPPRRKIFDGDQSPLGAWQPDHGLPEFDPRAFVRSRDALFLLSMEGPDSATALVTALVGRCLDHAMALAARSPGGRLRTPLVGILDEAANVCKLTDLPYLYSHLGSQGIVLLTFLQSPAQASEVWTSNQLDQLLSASNIHYYAGGITDPRYLQALSERIGDHDVDRWSASLGRGGSSRSQSWTREATLPVNLLAELPKHLAIVCTTGNPPMLVRKNDWRTTRYADAITASLTRYAPPADGKELL
ncbi:TraM recognition domain-containing protein [Nocardia sp. NBC_00511]|uniref:type IV secretory system conjugative DNA transfer family protein n=1 Tax=Nocardia sp. NBC_00511 TaxID=2903591 RepID=UPI002F914CD7